MSSTDDEVLAALLRLDTEMQRVQSRLDDLANAGAPVNHLHDAFIARMIAKEERRRALQDAVFKHLIGWGAIGIVTAMGAALWRGISSWVKHEIAE